MTQVTWVCSLDLGWVEERPCKSVSGLEFRRQWRGWVGALLTHHKSPAWERRTPGSCHAPEQRAGAEGDGRAGQEFQGSLGFENLGPHHNGRDSRDSLNFGSAKQAQHREGGRRGPCGPL